MAPNQSPQPVKAHIYARISSDRGGEGLGVERQIADCEALANRLGWEVVDRFIENDTSAFSGKARPQYRAMLEAIRSGEVRGILAWHSDRLHRRAADLEEFVTVVERHRVEVQTVTAGNIDLATASGRLIARLLGATAMHEIEHARERMKRAKTQAALDGKHRGGPRPFGYESDGMTVRDNEAEVIRELTRAVIAGRSLTALSRDLNDRGIPTSTGRRWGYGAVRDLLVRPRNAGLVSTGRVDHIDEVEIIGDARWPAVLDRETWEAARSILLDPSRRTSQTGNSKKWLGSGIYRCGRCGAPMVVTALGATPARGGNRRHYYRCTASAHLTISQPKADEHVIGVVKALISDPRIAAAMTPDSGLLDAERARRLVLTTRLEAFEQDYAKGHLTGAQLARATATVSQELAGVEDVLTRALRRCTAGAVVGAVDPAAAFDAAPLDVQRAVLAAVVAVEVEPATGRGSTWAPDRLSLTPIA